MVADLCVAITQGVLVALAKHCRDACAAVKRYPEESARIRLRLTYLLSSVPEWSCRIGTSTNDVVVDDDDDDPNGHSQLRRSLYDSLSDLTLCVQALGSIDDKSWRKKIKLFLQGKILLDKLNEAEAKFNQVLDDLNHDSTNFIALQLPTIQEQLSRVTTIEAKLSCMISLFKQFDKLPARNTNLTTTLNDAIEKNLEEFHKHDAIMDTYSSTVSSSSIDTAVDFISIDRRNIVYDASALETRLGKGGFAEVFKGTYNKDEVAVKVIDIYRNYDRLDEMPLVVYRDECNRVQDEAILMKQCSIHSNVVDVYGYCPPHISGSKPLIVMELMYASLNKILHQRTNIDISYNTRLQLMTDIAKAVEFLHLQGIVHQDIKASNILVDECITVAKLADFGVAECKGFTTTWTQRHTTALATVLKNSKKHAAGTLAYQAPELILEQVTIASRSADMYSLGVTIWECLSRTIPHYNRENKIILLAQNTNKLMMMFPVKDVIGTNINIMPNECDAFTLLEKVSLMCTSRDPSSRPTATNVVHYLTGTCAISPSFPRQYLSQWLIDVDNWSVDDPNNMERETPPPVHTDAENISKQFSKDAFTFKKNDGSEKTNFTATKPIQASRTDFNQLSINDPNDSNPRNTSSGINNSIIMEGTGTQGMQNASNMCKIAVAGLVVAVLLVVVAAVYFVAIKPTQNPSTSIPTIAPSSPVLQHAGPTPSPVLSVQSAKPTIKPQPIAIPRRTAKPTLHPTAKPTLKPENEPTSSPTVSPSDSVLCFTDTSELRSSVLAYINNDTSGYEKYGTSIGSWCVDYIEDFSYLFGDDTDPYTFFSTFNDDISQWNTSAAKNMSGMFLHAVAFNRDVSKWDVSSVTDMSLMFFAADGFNIDLSPWDVSSVTDMYRMFYSADSFNQNLCEWGNNLNANTNVSGMFNDGVDDTPSSCPNTNDPNLSLTTKGPFCYSC